ncbi:hypothetical protein FH969_10465 [Miniimonas arenae]|uniref:RDD family protein n=1 Tax=Miniimonas arenae TaxID=676201 RepID=A0A5C5BAW7_9MICO|nr:hypothetical protein [Miniimonas arenae]TNU73629.1 hypothetical protein FH969_10465 [Miniimonas arenae]
MVGSLLALGVPARLRGFHPDAQAARTPAPVTRGRRFLAMLCDLLWSVVTRVVVAIAVQLLQLERRDLLTSGLANDVAWWVVLGTWLVLVLATGRTVGDVAVELRFVREPDGAAAPRALRRPLRFVAGIGGFMLLDLAPPGWQWAAWLFAAVSLVAMLLTVNGRGLPGLVTGMRVADARER